MRWMRRDILGLFGGLDWIHGECDFGVCLYIYTDILYFRALICCIFVEGCEQRR